MYAGELNEVLTKAIALDERAKWLELKVTIDEIEIVLANMNTGEHKKPNQLKAIVNAGNLERLGDLLEDI